VIRYIRISAAGFSNDEGLSSAAGERFFLRIVASRSSLMTDSERRLTVRDMLGACGSTIEGALVERKEDEWEPRLAPGR